VVLLMLLLSGVLRVLGVVAVSTMSRDMARSHAKSWTSSGVAMEADPGQFLRFVAVLAKAQGLLSLCVVDDDDRVTLLGCHAAPGGGHTVEAVLCTDDRVRAGHFALARAYYATTLGDDDDNNLEPGTGLSAEEVSAWGPQ
jgi:hypothetical protein